METRAEATERVTCQAAAWLWHQRECRALMREAGLSYGGVITTAWGGHWRVDLVGLRIAEDSLRAYVIEVKGAYADLAREKIAEPLVHANSKWHQEHMAKDMELWCACGDLKTGWVAVGDVPEHWGVIVFPAGDGRPEVLRKPERAARHALDSGFSVHALSAAACVQTAERMPRAFNSRRFKTPPWKRLRAEGWYEDREWTRDNEQMEIFDGEADKG